MSSPSSTGRTNKTSNGRSTGANRGRGNNLHVGSRNNTGNDTISSNKKNENIWHPKGQPRDDASRNVNENPNDAINPQDEAISHAKDNIDTISRKLSDKLQLNNEERTKKKGQSNQGHRKDGNKRPNSSHRRKKPTESEPNPQEQTSEIKSSNHPINNDDDGDDDPENPKNKNQVKLSLAEFHLMGGREGGRYQRSHSEAEEDEAPSRILWVGNIGPDVSDEEIRQEFSNFGKIESFRILHHRFCAFVNFEEEESAIKAKAALQGVIMGSQYIVINFRRAGSVGTTEKDIENNFSQNPSRALWIGNISSDVTQEELYEEFSHFGEIQSVRLLTQKTCAFVNFMNVADATNALNSLQGKKIGKMAIKINFGKPQPPPKRNQVMHPGYASPYMASQGAYYDYPYPMAHPYSMQSNYMMPYEYYQYYQPTTCESCAKNINAVSFVPCTHSTCSECWEKIANVVGDKAILCPYCSEAITSVMALPAYPTYPSTAYTSSYQ